MNVHVHIDHLVVDGIATSHAELPDVSDALQSRLVEVLFERGLPGSVARLASSPVALAAMDAPPERASGSRIGSHVADALYGALSESRVDKAARPR